MLILSSYILVACINTIYKYGHDGSILAQELYICSLKSARKVKLGMFVPIQGINTNYQYCHARVIL